MAGNVITDLSGITGYALLIIVGLAIWIGIPILNAEFGTQIMTDLITVINGYPIYMNRGIGGGLAGIGVLSYLGFRLN